MSYSQKCTPNPIKVSIVPRSKGPLGFSMSEVSENKLNTKEDFVGLMNVMIGGRCAEQIFFNKVTNGAQDDIKRMTSLAYTIITKYGMGDNELKNLYIEDNDYVKNISQHTQAEIDKQVKMLIDKCYHTTLAILHENKDKIDAMANRLIEKETIHEKDIEECFGIENHNRY